MQVSQIPVKIQQAWANAATSSYVNALPLPYASQQTVGDGHNASMADGFPPVTFNDPAAGGIPPDGKDMNAILKWVTQWLIYSQAGGTVQYDSAFSAAIGGYPNGSVLASTVTPGLFWLNLADNNTVAPDSGSSANWRPLVSGFSKMLVAGVSQTFVTPYSGILRVRGVGAGGGSAGSVASQAGGGGGAGGYFEGMYAVTAGLSLTITIGAPGTAGPNTLNSSGGTGGTTSVAGLPGGTLSATGGAGGALSTGAPSGGIGGNATGGLFNTPGGYGGDGTPNGNSYGGYGGVSAFGGGGRGGSVSGAPGQAYGSGAGGCYNKTTAQPGQIGAQGVVIVEY